MRVAIDAVLETGTLCEGAICYSADLFDETRPKYGLKYYLGIAKELQPPACTSSSLKDMAGVCRPRAAAALVKALKEETGLPLHFHTHDTSGAGAASVLAAIDAGCDAVDGALDAMSGLTSQPNLSAIAAALAGSERDPGLIAGRAACRVDVLGGRAPLLLALRVRHPLRHRRRLPPRDARRPVHQPARAGARARPGAPLDRGVADLLPTSTSCSAT